MTALRPKISFRLAALAMVVPGVLAVSAPAAARDRDGWHDDNRWEQSERGRQRGWNDDRGYRRGDYGYNGGRHYGQAAAWRGEDGRYYCRRQDGTTGLLIGGAVGAVLGHEVAGRRGDRTLGAILGAAGGALLGREIDRSGSRCR